MTTTMLIATLALTLGGTHSSKAAVKATPEARMAQAFAYAEDDLEVRRSQLGLLGSAPFLGEKPEVTKAAAEPCATPAAGETRMGSRP